MPAPLPADGTSLTHAGLALVSHLDGTIRADDASGLYAADRRIIRGMRLLIDGEPASVLSGSQTDAASDRLVYGFWRNGADPAALIQRDRTLDSGLAERFTVTAFGAATELTLTIEIEPGNATVYDLDTESTDPIDPPELEHTELLETAELDGFVRDGDRLTAKLSVDARGDTTVGWRLPLGANEPRLPLTPSITASDPALDHIIRQAAWDLDALTVVDPKTHRPFTAAGAPHLLAVFGRDAILSCLLSMSNGTDRALDTLDVLAAHQGVGHDPDTLEEPGRILHELRIGDMGVFGLEPGTPYYGSIDATPLFVVLLRECLAWGASPARLRPLLPAARAAVDWCRHHVDGLGFVQSVPDPTGISNQNWKDSDDSVVRADGSTIEGPTTPVEVQGYVHAALLGLAELEEAIGDPTLAVDLQAEAADLRARFTDTFVIGGASTVSFSLDDELRPLDVCASNVGHLLATDVIDERTARRLTDRLLRPTEFSGWGIRTLAADETGYNPLGCHVGTVWPHDNALILRGLSRRGYHDEARRLIDALTALATALDGQLPELLGGFSREELSDPVPYPASARPQAWAAAVPFQIVTSLLGLRPALHRSELRFAPMLGDGESLSIRGLRLGGRLLDIEATGTQVTVTGDVRGITIVTPAPPI